MRQILLTAPCLFKISQSKPGTLCLRFCPSKTVLQFIVYPSPVVTTSPLEDYFSGKVSLFFIVYSAINRDRPHRFIIYANLLPLQFRSPYQSETLFRKNGMLLVLRHLAPSS